MSKTKNNTQELMEEYSASKDYFKQRQQKKLEERTYWEKVYWEQFEREWRQENEEARRL